MKLLVLTLLLISPSLFAQNFEGKIIYKNSYKSKMANLSDEKLSKMIGTNVDYFIKGNNYKCSYDGTSMKGMTYLGAENTIFSTLVMSDSLYWQDCSTYNDTPTKYEIKKDAAYVMGLLCDVIIVTTPKTKISSYYNKKYGINPELYKNHANGNWYYIISKINALPIKTITENDTFIVISTAVSITPEKLNNKLFEVKDRRKLAPATW